jgi:hypothetical protein
MNRTHGLSWVLVICFSFFSYRPAGADVILTPADGAPSASMSAGNAPASGDAVPAAVPSETEEACRVGLGSPSGSPELLGMVALGLLVLAGYFFGATAHPTPGW